MTYLEKTMTTENLSAAFDTIYHSLERRLKKLLVVTAQAPGETDWQAALGGTDVETIVVGSGGEALAAVRHQYLDAIVVDFGLADIPATQLVDEIHAESTSLAPPIVVYSAQPVSLATETEIRNLDGWAWSGSRTRATGCWKRPSCCSTARMPISPKRSGRAWLKPEATKPRSEARRCWWWTMTFAISSRSPACWSSMTWRWSTPRMAARESRCSSKPRESTAFSWIS